MENAFYNRIFNFIFSKNWLIILQSQHPRFKASLNLCYINIMNLHECLETVEPFDIRTHSSLSIMTGNRRSWSTCVNIFIGRGYGSMCAKSLLSGHECWCRQVCDLPAAFVFDNDPPQCLLDNMFFFYFCLLFTHHIYLFSKACWILFSNKLKSIWNSVNFVFK